MDALEARETPVAFFAVTVNVYEVPGVKPVIVIGEPGPVAVIPPGEEVTVYSVIFVPPLLEGAVNAMEADVLLCTVADTPVGAPGTVPEVMEFVVALPLT